MPTGDRKKANIVNEYPKVDTRCPKIDLEKKIGPSVPPKHFGYVPTLPNAHTSAQNLTPLSDIQPSVEFYGDISTASKSKNPSVAPGYADAITSPRDSHGNNLQPSLIPKYPQLPTSGNNPYETNSFSMDDLAFSSMQVANIPKVNHERAGASFDFLSPDHNYFANSTSGPSNPQVPYPLHIPQAKGSDIGFNHEAIINDGQHSRLTAKNGSILAYLDAAAAKDSVNLLTKRNSNLPFRGGKVSLTHKDQIDAVEDGAFLLQRLIEPTSSATSNLFKIKRSSRPPMRMACNACIRGHRAPSCKHYERPLLAVRPRGRPSSLCSGCLEKIVDCACSNEVSEKACNGKIHGTEPNHNITKLEIDGKVNPTRLSQYYKKLLIQTPDVQFSKSDVPLQDEGC